MYQFLVYDDDPNIVQLFRNKVAKVASARLEVDELTVGDDGNITPVPQKEPIFVIDLSIRNDPSAGEAIVEKIRLLPQFQKSWVLVLSGCKDNDQAQRVYSKGADLFVKKPLTNRKMQAVVDELIDLWSESIVSRR